MSKVKINWLNETRNFDANLTDRIVRADNPYTKFDIEDILPSEEVLLNASSILKVIPISQSSSLALQIAYDEYCHFVWQTYYFEVLGFQVLSTIACYADSLSFVHEIAAQAVDEARHIQIYRSIATSLSSKSEVFLCFPELHANIIESTCLAEKSVKGFLMLESLAIGMFSSRIKFYPKTKMVAIDAQILKEETQHQSYGVIAIAEFIKSKLIKFDEVVGLCREASSSFQLEILPIKVAEKHGFDLNKTQIANIKNTGFLDMHVRVSLISIRQNLLKINRMING